MPRRGFLAGLVAGPLLLGMFLTARADAALAAPPNDDFADAQLITGSSGTVDGTLAGATVEPGESSDGTGLPSIWYRWTAPQTGLFRFDTSTGVFRAELAIYTGSALGELTWPAHDWCPPTPSYDRTTYVLHATAGSTYSLALTGYSASVEAGRTTLQWAPHVRPANDAFAAATTVGSLEPVLSGDNCASTVEPGEPLDEYTSRRTVWFSWTPTVTVTEMLPDVAQHLIVTVYTGSSTSALTKVVRTADVHGEYGASFTAKAGTTYRIQVDSQGYPAYGLSGPQPPFAVAVRKIVPCNDTFSCSQGLANDNPLPLTGSVQTDNVGATVEVGEPAHAGSAAAHSLWWLLTPPVGATVTLSTAGSGIDTVLAIYIGDRVDALTPVAADDDSAGGGASRVVFAAVGGRSYRVVVDGKAGAAGQVQLAWRLDIPAPRNDMFANATAIAGQQGNSPSYTWSATKEAGEPAHEGVTGGRSVWWRYTAPEAGRLRLSLSSDYTVLSVYRGSSVGGLTRVAGAKQLGIQPIVVDVDVAAGVTYSIAVDVTDLYYGPDVAALTWTVYPPRPPNDDISGAISIGGASGSVDGHDVGATQGDGDPYNRWGENSTVFYVWTAPSTGLFLFDTLTSDYDTNLWMYRGRASSLASLPLIASNDDAVAMRSDPNDFYNVVGADHTSSAALKAVAGQLYTIVVDGPSQQQGRFTMHWAPGTPWVAANDAFAAAVPLTGSAGSVAGRLADTTREPGEPSASPDLGGEAVTGSLWYSWTAPASGPIRFWTDDEGVNPLLSVYTGGSLATLTLVAENAVGRSTSGARVDVSAMAGTTYRIRLAVRLGEAVYWPAAVRLIWGPPPAPPSNDAFAGAVVLSGGAGSVDGTAQWSTREPGEPGPPVPYQPPDTSVWYRWTAPMSGVASFWAQGPALSPEIGVYTGNRVDALAPLSGIGTPGAERLYGSYRITFPVAAGVTYQIQVQGSDNLGAPFRLLWTTARPPHDDLANALSLSGASGQSPADDWRATTIRATAEPGEPQHAPGRSPGATTWFRWTAPATGPVTFSVIDASVANVLAAYTGTGYGSLVRIGYTDYSYWHELRFDALAGQSYLIVADTSWGGGQLRVGWEQYADQVKPTGSVVIDGGAAGTGQRLVTLALSGADNVGVSEVLISNSPAVEQRIGIAGTQWTLAHAESLHGNPSTVRWSVTDLVRGGNNASGTKTVYVQWKDGQGNFSPIASDTIVANLPPLGDSLPPTGSVTINGGAVYAVAPSVSLSLPASDNSTGVAEVRISNRPETSGGLLTYGSSREWTVTPQSWSLADSASGGSTANGTRSVYAQFRDGAGNWSPVYRDTIVLDTAAPTVVAPRAEINASSTVGSSVPARVSWSATDATSGVAGYQVEQSTDGGAWSRLSLSSPMATSVTRSLSPGHGYRFRVRAVDRAGSWSGWKYGPVLGVGLHQESSTALTWSGTWSSYGVTGASGGGVRGSTQAGAKASFTASMRSVGWAAIRGPTRGQASVYVDGVLIRTVDLYASTVQPARIVFTRSWTSTGTHTVTVRVVGTAGRPRVEVDAFVLLR